MAQTSGGERVPVAPVDFHALSCELRTNITETARIDWRTGPGRLLVEQTHGNGFDAATLLVACRGNLDVAIDNAPVGPARWTTHHAAAQVTRPSNNTDLWTWGSSHGEEYGDQ